MGKRAATQSPIPFTILTPVAAAVLLGLSGQAFAQAAATTPSTPSASQVQTVTITSGKRSEAAHRVPYNVSAIEEEELREQNITDGKKVVAASDAINAPGNSARYADSVTVRGLNVSPVNANNLEQFIRSTRAMSLMR